MSDHTDSIRAVVLATLMVLSVFAGTVAFAGTAAAQSSVDTANSSITPNTAPEETTNDHTVTLTANGVNTDGTDPQVFVVQMPSSVDLSSTSVDQGSFTAVQGNVTFGSATVDDTSNQINVTLQDAGGTGEETVEVQFDITNVGLPAVQSDTDVDAQFGVDYVGNGNLVDPNDAGLTTFETITVTNAPNRPGGDITDTAYLGEENVDLRGVTGISQSGSVTLYGVAGEADGSTAQVGDVTDADITASNNFQQGGYSVQSDDETVELSVVEPRVTGLDIYRGDDDSGAEVTNGSILTSDNNITVEADYNFENAEGLEVTIEDSAGLEVQTQLTATSQQGGADTIDSSGDDDVTFSGLTSLDTGEYTVTVEGEDNLDGASRSATFTIRDEDQTISLDESTVTKGDSVVATVTGTPGNFGVVKIDATDSDFDSGEFTSANAATVFDNTGDVTDIVGTDSEATAAEDDWFAAEVDLDDEGESVVRIQTENIEDGTIDVEFVEYGDSNQPANSQAFTDALNESADDSAELSIEDQDVNITSSPSVVRIGEDFEISGTAPEADDVKAYARVDQNYVPLYEDADDGDAATDDVDSNGEFTVEIDSSSVISLPDAYRIAIVADPTEDTDNLEDSLDDVGQANDISSSDFSDFDTFSTVTVRTVEGDLTAQLSSSTIAANVNDELTLSGTALGQGDEIRVYAIGPRGNFYDANGVTNSVATIDVEENEFEEDFSIFDNRGTYTLIVGGPGRDGDFANNNNGFDPQNLPTDVTPQQAVALVEDEHTGPGSDDQVVTLSVQAENPQLTVDDFTTDGQVAQGEVTVSGTSNREDGTTVFIEVLGQNENVITSTEAEVNGTESAWETTIDMSDVETGTYTLRADDDEASTTIEFELVNTLNTPTETPVTDTPTDAPETDTPTDAPETDTPTDAPETDTPTETTSTSTPGFGVVVALVALIAAALLAVRRDN